MSVKLQQRQMAGTYPWLESKAPESATGILGKRNY